MMSRWNNFFPPEVTIYISDRSQDFTLPKHLDRVPPQQKKELFKLLDFSVDNMMTVRQIHGKRIVRLSEGQDVSEGVLEEADGIVTNIPGLPIAIRTADCVPVFLYDVRQRCLGLVHAGWRGTKEGIVREAVQEMKRMNSANPTDIKALIGPCIRSCCYQVSDEFWGSFSEDMTRRPEGSYLNLAAANIRQLLTENVLEKNIYDTATCTCCDQRWHSYRRDGEQSGRMISMMMLKQEVVSGASKFAEYKGGR